MAYIELDIVDFSSTKSAGERYDVRIKRKEWQGPNGFAIMRVSGAFANVSKFCKEWYGDDLDELIKGK